MLDNSSIFIYYCTVRILLRRVAQFGRALRSGRRGRKFKSCRADPVNMRVSRLSEPAYFMSVLTFVLTFFIHSKFIMIKTTSFL